MALFDLITELQSHNPALSAPDDLDALRAETIAETRDL
jgi:cephalosporin-C deacetylase-like acetyl esterase